MRRWHPCRFDDGDPREYVIYSDNWLLSQQSSWSRLLDQMADRRIQPFVVSIILILFGVKDLGRSEPNSPPGAI